MQDYNIKLEAKALTINKSIYLKDLLTCKRKFKIMFLGISTFAFAWAVGCKDFNNLSAVSLLNFAANNNIGFVQFGDNYPLHQLSLEELQTIKSNASNRGIVIETGTRGLTIENTERYIAIAVFFGSPFLRIVIDEAGYEPDKNEVISIITQLLPLLKKNNIVLALENHDRFSANTFREIIHATDKDIVGICLDTANSLGAGEGVNEVLQILMPYTVNLHIKDIIIKRVDDRMGFSVEGVAAGDGVIDIPNLIQQLETTGRCKSATLEIWSSPETTIEDTIKKEKQLVEKSIIYLRKYLS